MYVLAKFQLHILKAFKITTLQSSSNRKIDLYSKYRENKLQVLTKTDVTYEWSDVQYRLKICRSIVFATEDANNHFNVT